MDNTSTEFNRKLELDVLITGMTEVTCEYVQQFDTDNLGEVIIPKGVKKIGKYAFGWCDNLISVEIPDGVTNIDANAFCSCGNLTSVTIPASVTKIGSDAFFWCSNLKTVEFKDRTLDEVRSMLGYPWGIRPENISVQVS
jgi:hypothetical protein